MNQHPASDVRSLLELQQERIIEILQRDGPIESSPTLEKLKTAQQGATEADQKTLNEQALKYVLATLFDKAASATTEPMQYCLPGTLQSALKRLVDLSLLLTSLQLAEPGIFLYLVQDIAEMSTVEAVPAILDILEDKTDLFTSEKGRSLMSSNTPVKLSLLKTCKQMLRRLPKAMYASLAGRIVMFLSNTLPLEERSGVNLLGALNTSHPLPLDNVTPGTVDSTGKPVDPAFYRTFWGLQAIFQQPYSAIHPDTWVKAYTGIAAVLDEFSKSPCADQAAGATSSGSASQDSGNAGQVSYLSSARLMSLQMGDPALRRTFLVQCLILLHACQHPDKKEKDALRGKQVTDLQELEKRIYAALAAIKPDGQHFAASVRLTMERETGWAAWKGAGCRDFQRPTATKPELRPGQASRSASPSGAPAAASARPGPAPGAAAKAAGAGGTGQVKRPAPRPVQGGAKRQRPAAREPPRRPMPGLAPGEGALAGLQSLMQEGVPSLRQLLQPIVDDMDPENGIEEEYKSGKDPVLVWKVLRALSRDSMKTFRSVLDKQKNLEVAIHERFPQDVPAGATAAAGITASKLDPAGAEVSAADTSMPVPLTQPMTPPPEETGAAPSPMQADPIASTLEEEAPQAESAPPEDVSNAEAAVVEPALADTAMPDAPEQHPESRQEDEEGELDEGEIAE